MKRLLQTLAIAAPLALSLSAADQVKATKHDLSTTGTNKVFVAGTLGDQTCVYCHTPHSGATARGPLWNRAASVATYTAYGTTLLGTVVPVPSGQTTLACLSCHDGTVAMFSLVNNYYTLPTAAALNATATGNVSKTTGMLGGLAVVGPNMSNDHPVGIPMPVNTGYQTTAAATTSGVKFFGATNTVECASCHQVHNATYVPFLRIANSASALCTACHIK